jgi:hypothetical protein
VQGLVEQVADRVPIDDPVAGEGFATLFEQVVFAQVDRHGVLPATPVLLDVTNDRQRACISPKS